MSFKTALVIGGGAFGTCIASVLANNFEKVLIKVRSEDVFEALKAGENSIYLPGHKVKENIGISPDLEKAHWFERYTGKRI